LILSACGGGSSPAPPAAPSVPTVPSLATETSIEFLRITPAEGSTLAFQSQPALSNVSIEMRVIAKSADSGSCVSALLSVDGETTVGGGMSPCGMGSAAAGQVVTAVAFNGQASQTRFIIARLRGPNADNQPIELYRRVIPYVLNFESPRTAVFEAVDDSYTIPFRQTLTVDAPGLLANDVYPGSASNIAVTFQQPIPGRGLTNLGGGAFRWDPGDLTGEVQLGYRMILGNNSISNTATIRVTIQR
jgi:hypothetical protein